MKKSLVIKRALILILSVAVMFCLFAGYAGLAGMPKDAVYIAGVAAAGLIFTQSAPAPGRVKELIKSFGEPGSEDK